MLQGQGAYMRWKDKNGPQGMHRLIALTLALWTALAAGALAQGRPVVVELFTSQGCSSCPPADELLLGLAGREDVIPLALHVDYWDYIGWKDRFADPAHTKRQQGYARAAGEKMIYTPQIVVNGRDSAVGSKPMQVAELIRAHAALAPVVDLSLSRSGDELRIRAASLKPTGACDIYLLRYVPRADTDVLKAKTPGAHSRTVISCSRCSGSGAGTGRAPSPPNCRSAATIRSSCCSRPPITGPSLPRQGCADRWISDQTATFRPAAFQRRWIQNHCSI